MVIKDRDVLRVLLAVEEDGAEAKTALMDQGYSDDQISRLAYQLGYLQEMFKVGDVTTLASNTGKALFSSPGGLLPNGRAHLEKHRQRFAITAPRVAAVASIITAIAVIAVPIALHVWAK